MKRGIASRLNDLVEIQRPVTIDSFRGAGEGSWAKLDDVYAEVQDILPSRAESLDSGINITKRPARVRIRSRDDVTAAMRFVMGGRIMEIVAGPADVKEIDGLIEFMVEDYSTAGNAA